MKKLYFATGNKQKLDRMQKLANQVAGDFQIFCVPNLIDVEENGSDPIENALQKVQVCQGLDAPVIAGDTGVYFEGIAFDPTHVRRQALKQAGVLDKNLSQEEIYIIMLDFYKNLASQKGGEFPFYYLDGWAIKYPNGDIAEFETKRHNILTNQVHGEKQLYFPMCNLYKSEKTGKYYTDRTQQDYIGELYEQLELLQKIYNEL